ncbi:hypothetical protein LOK49_LG05G03781 [Camellia lanceoleosa]|uniref:Uncharacterized protein n=1 Tax=Camellia lanceoleosa TaxID=1840588 RepID=A0ACC0HK66_9ERIC|nr:hypothetical protein LOK49_LG05G03781 [Camellia lanceoleosa]
MSMASSSIPYINFSTSSPFSSFSSPSPSSSSFKFKPSIPTIRCSQSDFPLRRPLAPTPPTALKPVPPSPPHTPPHCRGFLAVVEEGKSVITLEFQRQKAKELQDYFK